MKRLLVTVVAAGSMLLAMGPITARAANDGRVGPPQTQPNPSSFATSYQDCLGPLRSKAAQGDFAGFGPLGEHFTGSVDPGVHYGTVGEIAFIESVLGLTPDACAALVGQ